MSKYNETIDELLERRIITGQEEVDIYYLFHAKPVFDLMMKTRDRIKFGELQSNKEAAWIL